jgi:hypothetical protein
LCQEPRSQFRAVVHCRQTLRCACRRWPTLESESLSTRRPSSSLDGYPSTACGRACSLSQNIICELACREAGLLHGRSTTWRPPQ